MYDMNTPFFFDQIVLTWLAIPPFFSSCFACLILPGGKPHIVSLVGTTKFITKVGTIELCPISSSRDDGSGRRVVTAATTTTATDSDASTVTTIATTSML